MIGEGQVGGRGDGEEIGFKIEPSKEYDNVWNIVVCFFLENLQKN